MEVKNTCPHQIPPDLCELCMSPQRKAEVERLRAEGKTILTLMPMVPDAD